MDMWLLIVGAIVVLIAVLAVKMSGGLANKNGAGVYKAGALMTENEREFFGRLVDALPDHYVFPQVGMGALIVPASRDKKIAHADRLRVAQQRVDFVISNAACRVIVVIELDDRTHHASKDTRRDERLQQGGIRTVRFQSKNKPDAAAIREAVLGPAIVFGTRTPAVNAA